jgi:aldehyde:ferredoxin oxidoreductase
MTITEGGLAGNMLRVNLTQGHVSTESLVSTTVGQFLMGTGYATKLLWDELEAGIDPLGPDNKLVSRVRSGCHRRRLRSARVFIYPRQ